MAVILDALASYVQNMLMEMAKDEVHMLLGVSGYIEKMDIKLKDLKNFLTDADRRNITDQSVQAWVAELRDAMYEATNILDICQLKAMERGRTHDAGCLNPLLYCMQDPLHAHKIGRRMKKLNQRLEEIKKRSLDFSFINLNSYEDNSRKVASSRFRDRETSGELDESCLVGEKIEEDTRNLVQMLTTEDENNKIMVFSIVGVGGIGKTTLAQKIFNHEMIQQEFSKKIWLSVNKDFSGTELLRRAIIEAGGDHQSTGNVRTTLERALKDALNGKKILLVMDDVWDPQAWEGVLKPPLVNASLTHGCRVLITTRHDGVAQGMMAKKPYHRVNKLEVEDAWLLLKKQVVGNENDEAQIELLKDIGLEIIAKCDCLPLAVKVIGGLLRHKTIKRGDWENVLNDWVRSVFQMYQELNYAVYLSYEDLHPCLKTCFLHYSLLPKNKVFFHTEIIGMWISEGFVHETSCDLEEVGKEYYDELIQRNLIEPDLNYADQIVCNMHDVVRSFAQYVARNEALVAQHSEIGISDKFKSQKFIRLSLLENEGSESSELEWCSLQAQTTLRTLISVGHIKIKPGDSLLAYSNIRTLHVEDANFDSLAESLTRLKHLRYLCLDRTNTSRLPQNIGKMKFLQYISLSCCESLVELPARISKLQQLRYLNLFETSIKYIHRGLQPATPHTIGITHQATSLMCTSEIKEQEGASLVEETNGDQIMTSQMEFSATLIGEVETVEVLSEKRQDDTRKESIPFTDPSVALGPMLDRALQELKDKREGKEKLEGSTQGDWMVATPPNQPSDDAMQTPRRRSKRRENSVDEDSIARAARLTAIKNLEIPAGFIQRNTLDAFLESAAEKGGTTPILMGVPCA